MMRRGSRRIIIGGEQRAGGGYGEEDVGGSRRGLNINCPRFLLLPRLIPFTLNGSESDLVPTSLKSHLLVAPPTLLPPPLFPLSLSLHCSLGPYSPTLLLPSSSWPPVRAGTTGERDESDGQAPGRLAPTSRKGKQIHAATTLLGILAARRNGCRQDSTWRGF